MNHDEHPFQTSCVFGAPGRRFQILQQLEDTLQAVAVAESEAFNTQLTWAAVIEYLQLV